MPREGPKSLPSKVPSAIPPPSLQVRSAQSPWYPYLTAVYGPNVPLPFNLHALRFIRHHTEGRCRRRCRCRCRGVTPCVHVAGFHRSNPDLNWPLPGCDRKTLGHFEPIQVPRYSPRYSPRYPRKEDARILRADPGAEIFAEIFAEIY